VRFHQKSLGGLKIHRNSKTLVKPALLATTLGCWALKVSQDFITLIVHPSL